MASPQAGGSDVIACSSIYQPGMWPDIEAAEFFNTTRLRKVYVGSGMVPEKEKGLTVVNSLLKKS
jgi:hypothetical protein